MIIYKYLSPIRNTYFNDELIRLTQPNELNDPFECLPQTPQKGEFEETIKTAANFFSVGNTEFENKILEKYGDNFIIQLYTEAIKKVNDEIGILSLSKNWDNPLMWAHYSDSHKGFCLGFDSTHQFFNDYLSKDQNESKYLKDVIYADERVKIPSKLDEPKLMFEPFLTKSTDWQYEQEVRLLSTLNLSHKKEQIDNRDIYTIKVPHTALVEINIGYKTEENLKQNIILFGQQNGINTYQTRISNTNFKMERDIIKQ